MENNQTQQETGKKFNIYEMVTKRILQYMMKGEIPWRKTYSLMKDAPDYYNAATGTRYRGVNRLLLGKPGAYATLKQVNDAGGKVKKGARSHLVLFWGSFIPQEDKALAKKLKEEGKDTSHLEVWFLKGYNNVFAVEDTEGADFKKLVTDEPAAPMELAQDPVDIADMVVRNYTATHGVDVRNDNTCDPFYDPENDMVVIPQKERFSLEEDYYASLFENLVHSTATDSRLARKREMKSLQEKEASAKEALIADMASSMILASAGLQRKETEQQNAADCQRWIEEMNRNYRLVVEAASGAERAARFVLGKYAA